MTGGVTMHDGSWAKNTITNNMFSVIVDPAKLGGADSWRSEVAAFVDFVKASPPSPQNGALGSDGVLVAGEPERQTRKARPAAGIPVDATTWGEIVAAGERVDRKSTRLNSSP